MRCLRNTLWLLATLVVVATCAGCPRLPPATTKLLASVGALDPIAVQFDSEFPNSRMYTSDLDSRAPAAALNMVKGVRDRYILVLNIDFVIDSRGEGAKRVTQHTLMLLEVTEVEPGSGGSMHITHGGDSQQIDDPTWARFRQSHDLADLGMHPVPPEKRIPNFDDIVSRF
jgi:hypothetical protein